MDIEKKPNGNKNVSKLPNKSRIFEDEYCNQDQLHSEVEAEDQDLDSDINQNLDQDFDIKDNTDLSNFIQSNDDILVFLRENELTEKEMIG